MSGLLFHRLPSKQHNQVVENFSDEVKHSSSSDFLQEETAGINRQSKLKNKTAGVRRQPPVAYASVAPFPFLPAPVYATEWLSSLSPTIYSPSFFFFPIFFLAHFSKSFDVKQQIID